MAFDIGRALTGTFAGEAFPTAGQGTIASDVDVQVNGTTYNSTPTGGGGGSSMSGSANARQPAATKNILYTSAGIVLAALVLLWLFGGIVFRVR